LPSLTLALALSPSLLLARGMMLLLRTQANQTFLAAEPARLDAALPNLSRRVSHAPVAKLLPTRHLIPSPARV
jgi:hypothetical protein